MNTNIIEIKTLNRLVAHSIHPKTQANEAYADLSEDLLELGRDEIAILIERLHSAIRNGKKTFRLQYVDKGNDSIHKMLHDSYPNNHEGFLIASQQLAEKLAVAHYRTRIPGGYCLVGEGILDNDKRIFFIIKAELQEVFNIEEDKLKLIRKVFLSPAKDFYKVGFFIEQVRNFIPFMYDDLFTSQKRDLTEYFYFRFLGLTTDTNDTLKSKNFYFDTRSFINDNIDNVKDKIGLYKALDVLYREHTSGNISIQEFADSYFEGELKTQYLRTYGPRYPNAFILKTELLQRKLDLQRVTIPLSHSLKIIGDQEAMFDVEVMDGSSDSINDKLMPMINTGSIEKVVVLKQKNSED